MARRDAGGYAVAMDREGLQRQAALRARAAEAIAAALAAADSRAPSIGDASGDAIAAVKLACWDAALDPDDRLVLVNEGLRLLAVLKELAVAPQASRPGLIVEIFRRTNALLRLYARFVQAQRTR